MFNNDFASIHLINDIKQVDEAEILSKIQVNTQLSLSYIALLVGSSIVCTLGLLLNAPPVIIGGMLFSPLMWPLIKVSLGLSYGRSFYIKQALSLIVISLAIALFSSSLITLISPIKLINAEITARASPTLLDLIVALVAGSIAALAITQPRISESLAGVAIATSLVPPLCVSGIALALLNFPILAGAFFLFTTNVVSIIFITVVTFLFVGVKSSENSTLRQRGVLFIGIILFITSIPLFIFMKNYSFKAFTYIKVQDILQKNLKNISPSIYLESVKTDVSAKGEAKILVEAQLFLPEGETIDYLSKQQIVEALETALGRRVDLNLRLQKTISVISEEDKIGERRKKILSTTFLEEIAKVNSSFSVDSLKIVEDEEKGVIYYVDVVIRSDPAQAMTLGDRQNLENTLSDKIGQKVSLNVEIVSRIKLVSNPDIENQKISAEIEKFVQGLSGEVEISSLSLRTVKAAPSAGLDSQEMIQAELEIKMPEGYEFPGRAFEYLKDLLIAKFQKQFDLEVKIIDKKTYWL